MFIQHLFLACEWYELLHGDMFCHTKKKQNNNCQWCSRFFTMRIDIFDVEVEFLARLHCNVLNERGSTRWLCWHDVSLVSTFITRSSIRRCCIQHHSDKSKAQVVGLWTHKRHSIDHPHRRAMGCLLWILWRQRDCPIPNPLASLDSHCIMHYGCDHVNPSVIIKLLGCRPQYPYQTCLMDIVLYICSVIWYNVVPL